MTSLDETIAKINELNGDGINLTSSPQTYDRALRKHEEALELARDTAGLNPDYLAVTSANIAYVLRRRDANRAGAISILDDALSVVEGNKTHFGKARVLEEKGLVIRYSPQEGREREDLESALEILEESITSYENAQGQFDREIVDEAIIIGRKLRTIGIVSTVASDLATYDSSGREGYLSKAIEFAQKEVDEREALGETSGGALANAYHTLAVAQTLTLLTISQADVMGRYESAKANLQRARELNDQPVTDSVLNFREAWLELQLYQTTSEANIPQIAQLVGKILEDQAEDSRRWDQGLLTALESPLRALGDTLQATGYQDLHHQIQELYQ